MHIDGKYTTVFTQPLFRSLIFTCFLISFAANLRDKIY
jgi:hypothetical protein